MPPLKKKRFTTSFKNTSNSRRRGNLSKNEVYEVANIVSWRIDPCKDNITLQFLVSWQNYGPENNSWEPFDSLRLNTVFINFINTKFNEFEADIFVKIANIKEKLKFKRRKALQDLKMVIMEGVFPFDPFEYKVNQVVFNMMKDPPKRFANYIKDLVFRNHFFKLDEVQRIAQDSRAKEMAEKEGIKIIIENDVDFEKPPEYIYITKNLCAQELQLASDTLTSSIMEPDSTSENSRNNFSGCKCGSNNCSDKSMCCPQHLKLIFPYKQTKNFRKVRLNYQEAIIECNENCSCNIDCLNRVTQQKRNLSLCLFKTEERGWTVKTLEPIEKGIFLLEYTGELIGCGEAMRREEASYLFDVNMDRLSHGYYTIDAFKFGNLARFVNHSCAPNSSMWVVSDCTKNPKNQKLCIFSLREIEADEEITIEYNPTETVPITERMNNSRSYTKDCFCGSDACRGTLY